jgi:histidinol dehydrogenase
VQKRIELRNWEAGALPADWFKRAPSLSSKIDEKTESNVEAIIEEVRREGDLALAKFTAHFDKVKISARTLRVTREEIEEAYQLVTEEQVSAIRILKDRVSRFEKALLEQLEISFTEGGITVQNLLFPIESVGCYIPGGQAAYPTTVVMTAALAKAAGVPRIVVCSPPNPGGLVNPMVLVASDICGVTEIFKVGGAQAIAALAYGTESIKPVRKIVGPGSRFVTAAKMLVSKDVSIDMPAGPSEVLVLADETANPKFIAADMISQAEHGEDSVAALMTTSRSIASEVIDWLNTLACDAERSDIIAKALSSRGFIVCCDSTEQMVSLANVFAPEHLEILTRQPKDIADRMTSSGLILIGPYSPVSLSDYGSGTNHVLPTGGFAHVFSGLSALDFIRRVSVVECSKEGLSEFRNHVRILTQVENLPNHYKAIEARFKNEPKV